MATGGSAPLQDILATMEFMLESARRRLPCGLPGEVADLLSDPPKLRDLARAYDWIRKSLRRRRAADTDDPGKLTLRLIRDLVVLHTCLQGGPWDNDSLGDAFEDVFCRELDKDLKAALFQSFNTVIRLGKDRAEFGKAINSVYDGMLDRSMAESCFVVFEYCAHISPAFVSRTKAERESCKMTRKPKPPRKSREVSASLGEPAWIEQPDKRLIHQLGQDYWVINGNTSVDVIDASSNCPSNVKSVAMTCPAWPGAHRELHQEDGAESDLLGKLDQLSIDDTTGIADSMVPEYKECSSCHTLDADGWHDAYYRRYYCPSCWKAYYTLTGYVGSPSLPSAPSTAYVGGPAIRHEALDRICEERVVYETVVCVSRECCLTEACLSGPKACLMVMGKRDGPGAEHRNGQSGLVMRSSTLLQAFAASDIDLLVPSPRFGGFAIPDVLVTHDGEGRLAEPFRKSMVYAAAPVFPAAELAEETGVGLADFEAEMRQKIFSVLRMCHAHGWDELILGAWGCGWCGAPPRMVADLFWSALFDDSSEATGVFRRVTFAIAHAEEAFHAFREVFELHLPAAERSASS